MKSFKTCGISNALDGTEDDELYAEEGQEIDDVKDNEFETDSDSEGESDADGEKTVLSVESSIKNGSFSSRGANSVKGLI